MSDISNKFKPSISSVEFNDGELQFILSGDDEYGFDKSLANAIRRTLLTDIPTVGFKINENGENNDINMILNNTSLHNEMLLHRISMIPLYINPENFMKNYLFECKIKHDTEHPYQFVTMNDINIYPLKSGFLDRLDKFFDESYDLSEEDQRILKQQLNEFNHENYDLKKPLSQKEKDKIVRPFPFRGNNHYSMITELKSTNTEDTFQELHFYGSPSVGYGSDHARFQGVSQATYSFTKDEDLIQDALSQKIQFEEIDQENTEEFERKFMLAESERYFYRDNEGEPNSYNFAIKSNHYYNSETLFKKSIEILIENCETLKLEFIELLKEEDSSVSVDKVREYVYHYEISNQSHTLGNLIQSHIVRRSIKDDSFIKTCGYKKPHPLEEKILFVISVNPGHKLMSKDEINKVQSVTTFFLEQIDEIINDLRLLYKVSEKTF
tara:strand:+ start:3691 stop:5007 length:1317 start_codon:yes stop_codon:yes gene_type:complete